MQIVDTSLPVWAAAALESALGEGNIVEAAGAIQNLAHQVNLKMARQQIEIEIREGKRVALEAMALADEAKLRQLEIAKQVDASLHQKEDWKGRLLLQYHPQVDIRSGKIVGAEALLRFDSGSEVIPPSAFFDGVDALGLMAKVGEWVVLEAARQYRAWGSPDIRVSVNISAAQVNSGLIDVVAEVSKKYGEGNPLNWLELEIAEKMLSGDVQVLKETLDAIKSFGVNLAIDDFGLGNSNLNHLHQLPFDTLKIDRAFVEHIGSNQKVRFVTAGLLQIAKDLGLRTIAEGVEKDHHRAELQAIGCQAYQGYLHSWPMNEDSFRKMLIG